MYKDNNALLWDYRRYVSKPLWTPEATNNTKP